MKFEIGDVVTQANGREIFRILEILDHNCTQSFIIRPPFGEARTQWCVYTDAKLHPTLNTRLGKILYGEDNVR